MLVGVVDSERRIVHRSRRPSLGLRQDELLETLERELRTALEARPDVAAAGLGIPVHDRSPSAAWRSWPSTSSSPTCRSAT